MIFLLLLKYDFTYVTCHRFSALAAARSTSKERKYVFTSPACWSCASSFPPPHLSNSFEFLISYFLPPVFASLDLITPASPQTPCQRWAASPGLRYSSSFFGHGSDLCLLSVLRIAGLNHAVCSVCDSPTEWLRGHHFQPVRDCRAAPPCQPVIISTRRPLFFSVARSLALSCSNRMITGC